MNFITFKNLCKASHKFFKWIKGNLTIKALWGYSENAVKVQSMKPYIEIAEKTKADAMKTFEDAMSE